MFQKIAISALFSSFILLTACGGGGSDGGADVADGGGEVVDSGGADEDPTPLFKHQTFGLERIDYDYDNNGIAEGVEIFSYDDSGKLLMTSYQYTEDGTADSDFGNNIYSGFVVNETIYTYDENDRVVESNSIATANTSAEASGQQESRSIIYTFEYDGPSEYPISITEHYIDENDVSVYRVTSNYFHDDEDRLSNIVRDYDPSIPGSASAINNPGWLHHVEYDYSGVSGAGSSSNFNYLDEFINATMINYDSDGLISSLIVTSDPSLSPTPPPLSSVIEYSYNDRSCVTGWVGGSFTDSGEIDYKRSAENTFDSQDRVTTHEHDGDLDGNVDSIWIYHYGEIGDTTRPLTAGEFGFPYFYYQGQETVCLND